MQWFKKIASTTALFLLIFTNKGGATELLPLDVKLIGDARGLVSIPENQPFLQSDNMLPGDVVERNMIIENKYDYPYEVFLRAERVTEKEKYDLLEKLNLSLVYNGKIIYEGPVSGDKGLSNNISLGVVKPGESKILNGKVELDGRATGNEYKNKYGRVDWIFTASRTEANNSKENRPYTGDTGVALYVILALVSSGALVVLLKNKKKD